jgi:hypothetical protein
MVRRLVAGFLAGLLLLVTGAAARADAPPPIMRVITDELNHLEAQMVLPMYTVVTQRPLENDAFTVISARSVKYVIVVMEWGAPQERQTRFVVAHEVGHIMLAERGRPQSEYAADMFAECYATVGNHELGCPAWQKYLRDTKPPGSTAVRLLTVL